MIVIYVDGSYNKEKNLTGSGIVLIKDPLIWKKYMTIKTDDGHSWNINGECHAVLEAIKIAVGEEPAGDDTYLKETELAIYYDYLGIEKWISGEWSASSVIAKFYISEFKRLVDKYGLVVTFKKVKAHSKNVYNEMADKLAKEAVKGIE